MSDSRGKSKKGKGEQSRTFKIQGKLNPAQWAELTEKLKKLLDQYGVRLTRAR